MSKRGLFFFCACLVLVTVLDFWRSTLSFPRNQVSKRGLCSFLCVCLCLCASALLLEANLKLVQGTRCPKEVCVCVFFVFAFVVVPLFDFWRPTISLPKELGVQKRSVYCIVEDTVAQDQECDPSERPAGTRVCPRWCLEYLMRILF